MFSEDDLLPISALQHLEFCPRQCGLIHLEGLWSENRLTAEGRTMHEKAHEPQTESRPGIRVARSLRLHSFRLGLSGQADVVEFHQLPAGSEDGAPLEGRSGRWQPRPVEYKRGSPKTGHCDIIQLCAQAICLEEMLGVRIEKGALFYGKPRRRQEVIFTDELRMETEELAVKLHELVKSGRTPTARYEKKCDSCSLLAQCMPKVTGVRKNIERYFADACKIVEETDL
jgi:CRISPR-associated exonuclease Cas4